ncbi:hypothetical protein Asppvi_008040 [Aspergillus pseudoviridinutans]|uniref:Uncharacterized protein n=1 Tax=Aspergillus pseudoviridinutans TaxID=1517512 RepID=A0A9P3EUZ5_9EURO|nr:uncharacterized protein Asppvi_008040 [Aspergillus pseudoviridinutans]GIJ89111.1 hypothetical protein Asppvi_008040 [Aspergillus pseudoviridinutans]
MATDSTGAWALWFLMLGVYSVITISLLFVGTISASWIGVKLRGKPTLAFRFTENGKETMVYVYNIEHWLIRAIVDDLFARKAKVEVLEAQNEQLCVSNDKLEGKSQAS